MEEAEVKYFKENFRFTLPNYSKKTRQTFPPIEVEKEGVAAKQEGSGPSRRPSRKEMQAMGNALNLIGNEGGGKKRGGAQ